jgi:Ca2+-binding RTX toxin-like protein
MDTIELSAPFYKMPGGVDNLVMASKIGGMTGKGGKNVTGNALANSIMGNAGDDTIAGLGGLDVIYGGAGSDKVFGGAGDDYLDGGSEGDTILGGDGFDTIVGGLGGDLLVGGKLADEIDGDALGVYVPVLDFGFLDDDKSKDMLIGGYGDDTYVIFSADDTINEEVDSGNDRMVLMKSGDFFLPKNVENFQSGTDVIMTSSTLGLADQYGTLKYSLYGNSLPNVLYGSGGVNNFYGAGGDDTIFSGGGDDTLNGGLGADQMYGGADDDVYTVDDVGDKIYEDIDGGYDFVYSSIDFDALTAGSDYIESIMLLGEAKHAYGTGQDNLMTASDVGSELSGFGGGDQLFGRSGDDSLFGGASDDLLFGDAGNDIVDGGEGDDQLVDGSGLDTLRGGSGNDVYFMEPSDGIDVVYDAAGTNDKLVFNGVDFAQLIFTAADRNLEVRRSGGGQSTIVVQDWFDEGSIESFEASGVVIGAADVALLVQSQLVWAGSAPQSVVNSSIGGALSFENKASGIV